MPYKGSKNTIAEWVIDQLPEGERLVDLFAGGCAVTHAAMLSGKWSSFLANDILSGPCLFVDAINGRLRGYEKRWVSRDEFFLLKDAEPWVASCYSFGNDCQTYCYSRELEPYKKALHAMLTAETLHERRVLYRAVVKELASLQSLQSLESLQSLQSLESLDRLQSLESLERLQTSQLDYREVELRPGDVVYCDIPYRNTGGYDGTSKISTFDYDAFYRWAKAQTVPVYISEYAMPDDDFAVVASKPKYCRMQGKGSGKYNTERIFRPRTQLEAQERGA